MFRFIISIHKSGIIESSAITCLSCDQLSWQMWPRFGSRLIVTTRGGRKCKYSKFVKSMQISFSQKLTTHKVKSFQLTGILKNCDKSRILTMKVILAGCSAKCNLTRRRDARKVIFHWSTYDLVCPIIGFHWFTISQ